MSQSPFAKDREHIVERTVHLWDDLRGIRVFLTGGTGFVGKWLLEAFIAANDAYRLGSTIVVLTRDPQTFTRNHPHLAANGAVSLHQGDASSFAFPKGEFACVMHAATQRMFPPSKSQPLGILDDDFSATRRVLEFASQAATKRFLFTSSGAVYGPGASELSAVSEDFSGAPDPLSLQASYGESKRLSEFTCASYARVFAFEAVMARLFAFVGPHLPLNEGYAVGNFVGDVIAGRPIAIAGDGSAIRSYLYAADMAIWLWTILLRGSAGRAYNVGSPHSLSISDLATIVARTLAPDLAVTIGRQRVDGAAPNTYVPNCSRAEKELGLQAWIDLPEALRRTYAYYRATAQ